MSQTPTRVARRRSARALLCSVLAAAMLAGGVSRTTDAEEGRPMDSTAGEIAYLYEVDVAGVGGRHAGRFETQLRRTDGELVLGPEDLSVEDALAWARQRAPVVLIRLGGDNDFYSAGRESIPDVTRSWPEGLKVLPRPYGEPPDSQRQTVIWAVNVAIPGAGQAAHRLAERVREALLVSGRLDSVHITEIAPDGYRLECTIDAPNSDEAVLDVDGLLPPEYYERVPEWGEGWLSAVSLVGRVAGR